MIAAYKGKSWRSKLTRFLTWSDYSHISWVDPNGAEIEAWSDGVRALDVAHSDHTPGTVVDLFAVDLTEKELKDVRWFLLQQVGKPYDWMGNLHFFTRRTEYKSDREKWFCSELVFAAFKYAGINLLERIPAFKVSPGLLVYSPLLRKAGTYTVTAENVEALERARNGLMAETGIDTKNVLSTFCNCLQRFCRAVLNVGWLLKHKKRKRNDMNRHFTPLFDDFGLVPLVNTDIPEELDADVSLVSMPNGCFVTSDEWWEVPFADVPYELENVKGVQRLNKEVATRMVTLFNSWRGKMTRQFGGLPVFVGHPDVAYFANRGDTDDSAYAWIMDMKVREGALALKVDLTDPGQEILANKSFKWFSPYFLGKCVGLENGLKIYEPVWLKSAGFTNNPRWPVAALVNAATLEADNMDEGESNMNLLQKIIALLGLGEDGAEAASEDGAISAVSKLLEAVKKIKAEIDAHWDARDAAYAALPNDAGMEVQLPALLGAFADQVETLVNEKSTNETTITDLTTAKDAAEASLAAERGARIELLVNQAVTDARILPADVDAWTEKLVNAEGDAFDTECTALVNATSGLKTTSVTDGLGKRNSEVSDKDTMIAMVNARMDSDNIDYQEAFYRVSKENPAMFAESKEGDK